MRRVCCCLVLVGLALETHGTKTFWGLEGFPNPSLAPGACGRREGESSRVCDVDGVLGLEGSDRIEAALDALLVKRVAWPEPVSYTHLTLPTKA